MKLLAVSHACVIDVNQRLLAELQRPGDVELTLIAPRRWRSDIRGDVEFSALDGLQADLRPLPVVLSGNVNMHMYRGLGRALGDARYDVVYLDEEPSGLVAYQFVRLRPRLGARLLIHSKQNTYRRYPFPFSWTQHQVLQRSDCIAAASTEGREVLLRKGRQGPIPVVPFAVDPTLFHCEDGDARRAEWGLDRFVIGYVGRLTPQKGILDLTAALEKLWAE
ncbi:MAG: glycosyltransferase, partial [Armatimonadota bacterium]